MAIPVFTRAQPHHFDGDENQSNLEETFDVLFKDLANVAAALNATTSGIDGATGDVGPQGADGDDGQDGLQGVAGTTGAQGQQGQSISGIDGDDGLDSVIPGPQGPIGAMGPMGFSGVDGDDGGDGIPGPQGNPGAAGAAGATGAQGPAGTGAPGQDGEDGDVGAFFPSTPRTLGTLYSDGTNASFQTGSVGVGVSIPLGKLHVTGASEDGLVSGLVLGTPAAIDGFISSADGIYINIDSDNTSTNQRIEIATDRTGASGGTVLVSILETGRVGINTASPSSDLSVNGLINIKNYTVATLPAGTRGDIAYVTDALAPAFLAIIVGGGAVVTPVFYNGTNWVGF